MSKKCIWCGGVVNPGLAGCGYYCPHCDEDLTEADVNDMTVFETITASPEVLAEKLVFWMSWHKADGSVEWFAVSTIVEGKWGTREAAIAATVAKLKEVANA